MAQRDLENFFHSVHKLNFRTNKKKTKRNFHFGLPLETLAFLPFPSFARPSRMTSENAYRPIGCLSERYVRVKNG